MKSIESLLKGKSPEVWSVGPGDSVYEAIAMMAEKGVGALLVLDGGAVVGVVSERDYARKIILQNRDSRGTLVKEIMSSRVIYARPEQTVEEGLALMTEKRIRHLPVMREKELLGIVSIGDLVKVIIDEQQFRIELLEQYISS